MTYMLLVCDMSYSHVQAGMELRLLHTVAHRQTWYGRWGFLFGRGGFATGKQVSACSLLHHITVCNGMST